MGIKYSFFEASKIRLTAIGNTQFWISISFNFDVVNTRKLETLKLNNHIHILVKQKEKLWIPFILISIF